MLRAPEANLQYDPRQKAGGGVTFGRASRTAIGIGVQAVG